MNRAGKMIEILRGMGYTVVWLAQRLEVTNDSVANWQSGLSVPRPANSNSLERLFTDIVGREGWQHPAALFGDAEIFEVVGSSRPIVPFGPHDKAAVIDDVRKSLAGGEGQVWLLTKVARGAKGSVVLSPGPGIYVAALEKETPDDLIADVIRRSWR